MKLVAQLLVIISLPLSGCFAHTDNAEESITIVTSNRELSSSFNWAKEQAASFVMTGKTGVINQSERSQGEGDYAYIPSYWAGYPFRSAFYSRDYCHQMVGAHLLGLQEENLAMLKAFASSASAERGWYPLWAFNFDGSDYSLDYVNDSNFVREVPAVFELVEKAYKQYLWTGNRTLLNDSLLWQYYTKAVTDFVSLNDNFIPNGVAEGSGTNNIFKGVSTYNEGEVPLIEAGDGIASQYQAFYSYAGMLKHRGDVAESNRFNEKADSLKMYFNNEWGVSKNSPNFVRGYTHTNEPATNFGRENSWFIPLKLISEPSDANQNYLRYISESLRDSEMFPVNIEAVTYLPDTYFAYNQVEEGWHWMKHIFKECNSQHIVSATGVNGNYPEVSFTIISGVVENMMGIEPDAPNHSFATIARLPVEVDYLGVNNIPLGKHKINVLHNGGSKTSIKHLQGDDDLKCNVRFYGKHPQIKINGTVFMSKAGKLNGQEISWVNVTIPTGEMISVEAL